jgi:hypothetical protein
MMIRPLHVSRVQRKLAYQGGFIRKAKPINAQVPMQHNMTTVSARTVIMETISPEPIELRLGCVDVGLLSYVVDTVSGSIGRSFITNPP